MSFIVLCLDIDLLYSSRSEIFVCVFFMSFNIVSVFFMFLLSDFPFSITFGLYSDMLTASALATSCLRHGHCSGEFEEM